MFFENVDYLQIPPRELRRKVGMVTQRPFLFPGTVFQNVSFGRYSVAQNSPNNERRNCSPEFASRDVANLSGGEARVAH
jgi:UDP-glucose/iron transport system ATP-binding protein